MISPPVRSGPFVAWLQGCGLVFILAGMLLAWSAAAANFAGKMINGYSAGTILLGGAFYLLLAAAALLGLNRIFRKRGDRIFLLAALGASLLLQLGAILSANREWRWTGDARIFRQYLEVLSETGYSPETLGDLSQHYDYRVWTRRAQPFYYALRYWSDGHFVLAAQIFQAILISLSLALAWRIVRLFFGRRVAFWATCLQLLMPFRWFAGLDLSHHILGGFYFLTGLWLLAEWLRKNRPPARAWGIGVGMAALLPLMRLEGGIDTVFLGTVFLALGLAWLAGRQNARQTLASVAVLLAVPLLAASVFVSPLLRRIDQADLHHHEVGPIGFMARGWAPETGGEYCYTYERVDYLTLRADKKAMQASILAAQALYNPRATIQLLAVKSAKYFLLGYAAGAEEMLDANGAHRAKRLVEGARTAFLLATLPLMVWGALLLLPLLRRPWRLELVVPCSALCATYVLLGETSPRYSIYIQPFLFMLGALPLAIGDRRRRILLHASRRPGLAAFASVGLAFLLGAGGLFAARPWLARHALQDMRSWRVLPDAGALPIPATLAPFEIHLQPDAAGTAWGPVRLPVPNPLPKSISFYAIPYSVPSSALRSAVIFTECATADGLRTQTNSLPGRIRLEYSLSAPGEVRFRSPSPLPFPLRIGYATYEFDEKTTD